MARTRGRRRFVLLWFSAGALLPLILILLGFVMKTTWVPSEHLGTMLWILTWLVWPSWIVLIDAEHTAQIIVMLLLSAVLNGFWYAALGFVFWQLFHRLKYANPEDPHR